MNSLGYWYISPCPASLIYTTQDPGIQLTSINESFSGESSVPTITNIGCVIFEMALQLSAQFHTEYVLADFYSWLEAHSGLSHSYGNTNADSTLGTNSSSSSNR